MPSRPRQAARGIHLQDIGRFKSTVLDRPVASCSPRSRSLYLIQRSFPESRAIPISHLLIIGAIFVVLLLFAAAFVVQQVDTLKKIRAVRPKSLLEKFSTGSGALDTGKFREIVMSGGGGERAEGVQSLVKEGTSSAAPAGEHLEL